MGHEFRKCWIFLDTTNWVAPEREYFISCKFDDERVQTWIKEHPIPINTLFSNEEEAFRDLTESTGAISVQAGEGDDFIDWYGGFISMLALL